MNTVHIPSGMQVLVFDDLSHQSPELTLRLDVGAHAVVILLHVGEASVITNINLVMEGDYSQAQLYAVYVTHGKGNAQLMVNQHHLGRSTKSSVVMRVLSADNSHCMYKGMIRIDEHARGSNAHQEHKALLLSPQARAVAEPMLEVLTNDVQCGHGSAVGILDQEQLFYMQARGLTLEHARKLLLEYFCVQAFDGISDPAIKKQMYAKISEHIHNLLSEKSKV